MSDLSGDHDQSAPPPAGGFTRRHGIILMLGAACGASVGAVVGMRRAGTGGEAAFEGDRLDSVTQAELDQAAGTLTPSAAAALVANARACREPLARVAIWHSPGRPGGTISIVAGSYVSPNFVLLPTPRLIALPYPAPYSSGHGMLTVLGDAQDVVIALTPARTAILHSRLTMSVWWTPVGACP